MKLRRTLAALAVSAVSALALVVLPGASAQAAPQCVYNLQLNSNGNIGIFLYVPTAQSGALKCSMGLNAQSDAVWALQRSLVVCYGQSISVDGIFGPKTKTALRNAQSQIGGIGVDGSYGPETAGKIKFSPVGRTTKADCNRPIPNGGD